MAAKLSTLRYARVPPPPRKFLVLISVRGWINPRTTVWLEKLHKFKTNSITPSEIKPATFRLKLRYYVHARMWRRLWCSARHDVCGYRFLARLRGVVMQDTTIYSTHWSSNYTSSIPTTFFGGNHRNLNHSARPILRYQAETHTSVFTAHHSSSWSVNERKSRKFLPSITFLHYVLTSHP
jgi:hypothetical protein